MRFAALFVLALATAGCQSPEEQMEDGVRNLLSPSGNVQEAELTEGPDGNMTGHAVVASASGPPARHNCTATKTAEAGRYDIRCLQALDEALLQAMEREIRGSIEQRGVEVLEVDMQRHNDDNHMRGIASVRENGTDLRLACTAERNVASGRFAFSCNPEGQAADLEAGLADDADQAEGEGGK
jgi:hypothetical protein